MKKKIRFFLIASLVIVFLSGITIYNRENMQKALETSYSGRLIGFFHQNRDKFEKVREMLNEDKHILYLVVSSDPFTAAEKRHISVERYQQYNEILKKLKPYVEYVENFGKEIFFQIQEPWWFADSLDYAWISGDSEYIRKGLTRFGCTHIDGPWFLQRQKEAFDGDYSYVPPQGGKNKVTFNIPSHRKSKE